MVWRFKFSLVLSLVVALLSLLPSSTLPKASSINDKAVHFGMYFFIAGVLILEGARARIQTAGFRTIVVLYCTFYGVLLEFGQKFVPGRNFDWWDALYNGLGGFTGCMIVYWIYVKTNTSL